MVYNEGIIKNKRRLAMDYLKIRCEEILNNLGYSYTDEDIVNIAKIFNEVYQYQGLFLDEYQVWWNVIDKYHAEHYDEK